MHPNHRRTAIAAAHALLLLPVAAQATDAAQAPIMVTATRTPTRTSDLLSDVSTLEREDIERAGLATLPELLSTLPGIQTSANGGRGASGSISIRGSNSNQVLVLIDGQRVSSATTGTTALEHIPLEQVERIEVLRGPASALYGADALGGVIQIFTRAGQGTPAPSFSLGFGSYGTTIGSVGYGGQSGDTRFNLQAGWEDSNSFSSIKAAKGGPYALYDMYNPDRDGYQNRNVTARLSHRLSSDLEVGADVLHTEGFKHFDATNCDSTGFVCTPNFDNRQRQTLDSYSAHASYQVSPAWKSSVRLGQSLDKMVNWRFDPTATPGVSQERYDTTQDQFTWQNDFAITSGKLMAALEWRQVRVASTQTFVVNEQATRSVVLGYQGWYGAHSLQLSARQDDIDRLGSHSTGSAAYGYRLTDAWTARASMGRAYHAPTFDDLYWPVDQANFYRGNPNLRPEEAQTREIGLSYERPGVTASITAYRSKVTNLLDYVDGPAPTYIGYYDNLASATLRGVSAQYTRRSGDWETRLSADVLSARDDATQRTLQRRAPRTAFAELRRHLGPLDLGLQLQLSANRFANRDNSQTLGGYGVVNMDAGYRIDHNWTVLARLSNLFDKDYTLVRSTLPPYNDYAVAGRSLFIGIRYAPK
ncbi:MAG: TonB-dependent receptor [Betaproteobacteria bacterium]|nr:TonB-dependent receptor [Betaproteobacteria bacterium]